MSTESANDAFERRYAEAFRALAAEHGVVVKYDRDRAARDIGLHLFRAGPAGSETATGSLVWFQLKGLRSKTLPEQEILTKREFSVPIRVKDLQLWYRTNGPTYLAVYVESVKRFFIVDILGFVERKYGKTVFGLQQETVAVPVDTSSVFDKQAFNLLLQKGDQQEWAKVIAAEPSEIQLCRRDYSVIWRLATAGDRDVEHKLEITDWQTKLRGEVALFERKSGSDDPWVEVREHIQFMFGIHDLESSYPYLTLSPFDEEHQSDCEWDNEDGNPSLTLDDGRVIYGKDASGEYNSFEMRPELNALGHRLWEFVRSLTEAGVLRPPKGGDDDGVEFVDVAPWHHRDV